MNEDMQALLDAVRRFVDRELKPIEAQVGESGEIPPRILRAMRDLGLFGISIPEEYGGLGLSMTQECALLFEFCRTSPAFRSAFGTNVGIGSQGIVLCGSQEQKRTWLPRIASGEIVCSFALTEANAGSDAASLTTRATRDGDDYVISGAKRYVTNADRAALFTVMVRTDEAKKGADGVSAILVTRDTPGVTIGKPEKKMGQAGAQICEVYFDRARAPAINRLGEEGQGFRVAMQVLDRGRVHIAAVCVGVAERLISDCVAYAKERVQFGRAISEFQMIQAMLADSRAEAAAARALVVDVAQRLDSGEALGSLASCAKLIASEMVGKVADRAVQIFGGAGYVADHGIERFYRDVRIFRIYEGTSEIQRLVIARDMLR